MLCPFMSDAKKQVQCVKHDCQLWTQLMGDDPQTGVRRAEWNCAIAWQPLLMVETANQSRKTTSSVDSFRNEMVKGNAVTLQALTQTTKRLANGHAPAEDGSDTS